MNSQICKIEKAILHWCDITIYLYEHLGQWIFFIIVLVEVLTTASLELGSDITFYCIGWWDSFVIIFQMYNTLKVFYLGLILLLFKLIY